MLLATNDNLAQSWRARVVGVNGVYYIQYNAPEFRAYYFLSVRPKQEAVFLAAMEKGELVNLDDYGEVVAKGWGEPTKMLIKLVLHCKT